jgi:hypothetical protein
MLIYITENMNKKLQYDPMFCWKKSQNNNLNLWHIKIKFVVFYYKYL